jgi:hypothetical protein
VLAEVSAPSWAWQTGSSVLAAQAAQAGIGRPRQVGLAVIRRFRWRRGVLRHGTRCTGRVHRAPNDGLAAWPAAVPSSNGPAMAALCVVTKQNSVIQVTQAAHRGSPIPLIRFRKSVGGRAEPRRRAPHVFQRVVQAHVAGGAAGNCRPARNCRWRRQPGRVPSRTSTKLGTLLTAKRSKASGSICTATWCWTDQALHLGDRVAQRAVGEAPEDDRGLGPRGLVDQTLQRGAGAWTG